MKRSEIVLAALAAGGRRARYDPVQVQQLLFLVDRELLASVGGTGFEFRPSAYGPVDPSLEGALGALAEQGRIAIDNGGPYAEYRLTQTGRSNGLAALARFGKGVSKHMAQAARWVLAQSFWGSIAEMNGVYPEMTADSNALEAVIPHSAQRKHQLRHPLLEGQAMAFGFCWGLDESDGTERPSDAEAIAGDWRAVGDDIRRAIGLWAGRSMRTSR